MLYPFRIPSRLAQHAAGLALPDWQDPREARRQVRLDAYARAVPLPTAGGRGGRTEPAAGDGAAAAGRLPRAELRHAARPGGRPAGAHGSPRWLQGRGGAGERGGEGGGGGRRDEGARGAAALTARARGGDERAGAGDRPAGGGGLLSGAGAQGSREGDPRHRALDRRAEEVGQGSRGGARSGKQDGEGQDGGGARRGGADGRRSHPVEEGSGAASNAICPAEGRGVGQR
mmetsp:Transcript_12174/g.30280  ORF Transcript_12174/g.30280 Transcript_12174/m.30280 type:complete len:230 (+) Transcript_12174:1428-2117(+)